MAKVYERAIDTCGDCPNYHFSSWWVPDNTYHSSYYCIKIRDYHKKLSVQGKDFFSKDAFPKECPLEDVKEGK